jgi:hypothetical protein
MKRLTEYITEHVISGKTNAQELFTESIIGKKTEKNSVPYPPNPGCYADEMIAWLDSIGIHGKVYNSSQAAPVPDVSKGGIEYRMRWRDTAKKGWVEINTERIYLSMGLGGNKRGADPNSVTCLLAVRKDSREAYIPWPKAIDLIEKIAKSPSMSLKIARTYLNGKDLQRNNPLNESVSGNRSRLYKKYGLEIDKNSTVNDIVSWIEENSDAKKIDRGERKSIKPNPGELFYCVGKCEEDHTDRHLNQFWVGVILKPEYYSRKLELYIYPHEKGHNQKSIIFYDKRNDFVSVESAIDLLKQIVEDPTKEPIIRMS